MLKKYIVPILAMLAFLSLTSFSQDGKPTLEEEKAGITQLKEAVSKLSVGMTWDEVVRQLGEPKFVTHASAYIPFYLFAGGQSLTLNFDGQNKLFAAYNKDRFDLLLKEYTAKVTNISVLVDGEDVLFSNPILTINGKIYLSVEELNGVLPVYVTFNEVMQQLEFITTDTPITIGFTTKTMQAPINKIPPDYITTIVPITREKKIKA